MKSGIRQSPALRSRTTLISSLVAVCSNSPQPSSDNVRFEFLTENATRSSPLVLGSLQVRRSKGASYTSLRSCEYAASFCRTSRLTVKRSRIQHCVKRRPTCKERSPSRRLSPPSPRRTVPTERATSILKISLDNPTLLLPPSRPLLRRRRPTSSSELCISSSLPLSILRPLRLESRSCHSRREISFVCWNACTTSGGEAS